MRQPSRASPALTELGAWASRLVQELLWAATASTEAVVDSQLLEYLVEAQRQRTVVQTRSQEWQTDPLRPWTTRTDLRLEASAEVQALVGAAVAWPALAEARVEAVSQRALRLRAASLVVVVVPMGVLAWQRAK